MSSVVLVRVLVRLGRLVRIAALFGAVPALAACNQDSYSSNSAERQTHMGDIKAAAPPPSASAPPASAPPAATAAAPMMAASPTPSASASH